MINTTAAVRRITRAYRRSTDAQRRAGLGWYAEALRVAQEISDHTGASVSLVVGVIAALSPRCQWSTNVMWTRAVVAAAMAGQDCPAVSTMANRRTAWRIAQGEDPMTALGTLSSTGRVVSGHKIRSFYLNILGNSHAVTVDIWAIRGALGATADVVAPGGAISAGLYAEISAAYTRAAQILGITPRECQAAVWVATRGVKPTDAGFHAAAAAA